MAFSKGVRQEALVRAARHCCVCHRYKGVKVEVHHIVAREAGGSDSIDNAIALCFDCHADSGHYNPEHPRGSKYSVDELRSARDRWHQIVADHDIESPKSEDLLYCRYLLCKDFGAIQEITSHNLANLPVLNPFLIRTEPFLFLSNVVNEYASGERDAKIWSASWASKSDYLRDHPYLIPSQSSNEEFPYFPVVRNVHEEELGEIAAQDHITSILIKQSVDPQEIVQVLGYRERCGEDRFQEIFRLRPFWAAFLAVTNFTSAPIMVTGLEAASSGYTRLTFREYSIDQTDDIETIKLPNAPVPPNGTILIPVANLLAPFAPVTPSLNEQSGFWQFEDLQSGQTQILNHVHLDTKSQNEFRFWGPAIHPTSIIISLSGTAYKQNVHQLDLNNTYVLDRTWEMGSCPHAFIITMSGGKKYIGEIFARAPFFNQTESIFIPSNSKYLIVAELEDETTEISKVYKNHSLVDYNITLQSGEIYAVDVAGIQTVTLQGKYCPQGNQHNSPKPVRRNELIADFIGRVEQRSYSFPIDAQLQTKAKIGGYT